VRYVVDTSIAIKWYIPEPLHEEAVEFLHAAAAKKIELLAPNLIIPDMVNILWGKCVQGEITPNEARKIINAIGNAFPVQIYNSQELTAAAFEIAHGYNRSFYDSLFLALAFMKKGVFITADERLVNSLAGTSLEPFVNKLPRK